MPTSDNDLADSIAARAAEPKRMSSPEGSVEGQSIGELIEADRYLREKAAARNPTRAMRMMKISRPGAT